MAGGTGPLIAGANDAGDVAARTSVARDDSRLSGRERREAGAPLSQFERKISSMTSKSEASPPPHSPGSAGSMEGSC